MELKTKIKNIVSKNEIIKINDNIYKMSLRMDRLSKQYLYDTQYKPLFKSENGIKYISELKRLLQVKDVSGNKGYIRVGRHNDGGYIMYDDLADAECVYSFGICDDVSWDWYFADKLKKNVFMYDHTIDGLPVYNKRFIWKKVGICGGVSKKPELCNFEEILKNDGNYEKSGMILKMDIEGDEREVISSIDLDILNKFDQIVIEMHDLLNLNLRNENIAFLRKLNSTHQLIHIHGNNNTCSICCDAFNLPDAIELTLLCKKKYHFEESVRFFPTELDEPNTKEYPEIPLGFFS